MPTYVGNCEWEPSDEYTIDIDDFGFDECRRPYSGREDKFAAFAAEWRRDTPDPDFPQLTLIARPTSFARGLGTCTLSFKGLFSGEIPPPIISGGWAKGECQLTNALTREQAVIEYVGPTTTIKYITQTRPTKPIYRGFMLPFEDGFQIVNVRGTAQGQFRRVAAFRSVPGMQFPQETVTASSNVIPYEIDVLTDAFDIEPVGKHWAVTEVNAGKFVDIERAGLPRVTETASMVDLGKLYNLLTNNP